MGWFRRCSGCRARGRQLSYYAPLTTQAIRLGREQNTDRDVWIQTGARLCPSCIIDLTR